MKSNDSCTKNAGLTRPGAYDISFTENIDDQGRFGYAILLSPKSDNSPTRTSDQGNSRTVDLLNEIRSAFIQSCVDTDYLSYPLQEESFIQNFVQTRDRARKAFRNSPASDDEVSSFEFHMQTDDELIAMAALIRRLHAMGLEESTEAFCDYVDDVYNDALKYAAKVLCG